MREPGGRRPVIEDPPDEAFNRTLPGLHTYLGNVGDVGSAACVELLRVLAESSGGQTVVRIPVVVLLDQVFFPGENIPLTFDHDDRGDARLAFEACMAAEPHLRGLFGVFTVYRDQSRFDLGTLAEIRQFTRGDPRGDGDDARMSLLARGRLRFTIRDETEFMQRVMDEAHFRGVAHTPTFPDVEVVVHAEPPVAARRGPPRGTFGVSGAPLTPHSAAVYGMFDAHALADRLRESPVLTLVCARRSRAARRESRRTATPTPANPIWIPSPSPATPSRCRTGSPRVSPSPRAFARVFSARTTPWIASDWNSNSCRLVAHESTETLGCAVARATPS